MEITDTYIKGIIEEVISLHYHQKDKEAYPILDGLVRELNLLDLNSYINANCKLQIICVSGIITIDKFYLLVGDVYTNVGEYGKALEAYKLCHFWKQQIKPYKSLRDKSSAIVYSYRSYNEFFIEDLINQTITLSPPTEMNDPFDNILSFWSEKGNLDFLSKNRKDSEIYSRSFDYYRIRSFVANKSTFETDNDLLKNVQMWSHYADAHKGLCVKYRLSRHFIKSETPFDNSEDDVYKVFRLHPVIYKSSYSLEGIKAVDSTELICRKQSAWEIENEVRLICYNPYINEKWITEPLKDSIIEEIIFGFRCTERHKATIYQIAKMLYPNILFSEMYIDETKSLYDLIKKEYRPRTKS